jgi:HSP20 family molecular chaperone IbpA
MWRVTCGCSVTSVLLLSSADVVRTNGSFRERCGDIKFLHGEYGIGDFHRTLTIGEAIDTGRISAELQNGVLTVHLPKREQVKPRRIDVKCR